MNKKEQRAADKAAKAAAEQAAQTPITNTADGPDHGPATTEAEDAAENAKIDEAVKANTKAAKTPKAPMTVTLADGTIKTLPALPKAAKKARKPKPGLPCSCGCGGTTKGGRFLTGHDSYLKSWCLRVERGAVKLEDIPDDGIRAAVAAHMTPAKTAE